MLNVGYSFCDKSVVKVGDILLDSLLGNENTIIVTKIVGESFDYKFLIVDGLNVLYRNFTDRSNCHSLVRFTKIGINVDPKNNRILNEVIDQLLNDA